MKTKRLFIVAVVIFVAFIGLAGLTDCFGTELEVSLGQGGKRLKEHGELSSWSRFIQAGVTLSGGEKFYRSLSIEAWRAVNMSDFVLDDSGTHQGGGVMGLVGYRIIKTRDMELTPVLGLYGSQIERKNPNPKWEGPDPDWRLASWTHLFLAQAVTGINFQYKWFYAKAYLDWPFYFSGNTPSPSNRKFENHEPHARAEIGIKWKEWSCGYRYEKQSFDQLRNTNLFTDMVFIAWTKRL